VANAHVAPGHNIIQGKGIVTWFPAKQEGKEEKSSPVLSTKQSLQLL
jgi:hypothetical protein